MSRGTDAFDSGRSSMGMSLQTEMQTLTQGICETLRRWSSELKLFPDAGLGPLNQPECTHLVKSQNV